MGKLRDQKPARLLPRLDTFTDIHAPIVKKERVNGKNKYSLTPAKPGTITIFSDDEDERELSPRSQAIKRERSQTRHRTIGRGHESSPPGIKQETPPDGHDPPRIDGQASGTASSTRRNQVREPLRRSSAHSRPNPPSDTSSSDSSGSDSSNSSESDYDSDDDSDSSSDSSSSDGSSSRDEARASVYRPSTPRSSIESSPTQTRRKKGANVRAASANPATASLADRSASNGASLESGRAPLDFFIDLPSRPIPRRPEHDGRPRSHTSSAAAPTRAQVERASQFENHAPRNASPVVLGFMPINRGSSPPKNVPTEPRAMRPSDARNASAPARAPQRSSIPNRGSASGSSSLPYRGVPPIKDNPQQKDQQRRGPARRGRTMQTVEKTAVGLPNTNDRRKTGLSSIHLRPATPGPSSRRTAPPQPSPGMFVTPRAVSVAPFPVPIVEDSPQSVSRRRGKRALNENDDADSVSKAVEWERMLVRIRNHQIEMEQQRTQLEDTKRMLAEQKTRIDYLVQRGRTEAALRNFDARTQNEERGVTSPPAVVPRDNGRPAAGPRDVATTTVAISQDLAPRPEAAPPSIAPRRVSTRQSQRVKGCRRRNAAQAEGREGRRQRHVDQGTKTRSKRQRKRRSNKEKQEGLEMERRRIEQERQEELEVEQQLEQEQHREAERHVQRLQSVMASPQNAARQAPGEGPPKPEVEAQRRIQQKVFTRPLSGHNPKMIFDDDDRPHISEATAFLMRLPQTLVWTRLRKLAEGKPFFDTAHPSSVHMGCWVVSSKRAAASCDMRMKLSDSGEKHGFSFPRLAVRLWHDEQSLYSLVQHHKHRQNAVHICHNEQCMCPDHIVVEPSSAAAERRRCKREGWCPGHEFFHKDGTRQARKPCIFLPQNALIKW